MIFKKHSLNNSYILNFGPQHPAAHGVLRLILELNGEFIKNVDPHIGLLHRGTEKLIESKTYLKSLPYFDRLDYVSSISQEYSFILGLESLFNINVPKKAKYMRVLCAELTRISNHLMAITTHALDVGAITPFLWGFEEREKIMNFFEQMSGARMHMAFFRVGGVYADISHEILLDIKNFIENFKFRLAELEELLSNNFIWINRLKFVGVISKKQSYLYSLTGPILRSVGVPWDLRKTQPYDIYNKIKFKIPFTATGDCYDRYLIRIREIRQSLNIINQCINNIFLLKDNYINYYHYASPSERYLSKNIMENLIRHFLYYSNGFSIPSSSVYIATESPKGEFGVFLKSDGSSKLYRCKIRSTGFYHLQALKYFIKGQSLADLVTIIGTLDIVFGEIDR